MGLFSRFFKRKTEAGGLEKEQSRELPPECQELFELRGWMEDVLGRRAYIARSAYREKLAAYRGIYENFSVIIKNGLLEAYCEKHRLSVSDVEEIVGKYEEWKAVVDLHNENYLKDAMEEEREYLDGILRDVDPEIVLDEDQRKVVLTDEDYCLVIAGAGAGKTTTVAAKVRYLVDKKEVDPSQILVVSFTNKAVQELRDKINDELKIACPIATFHSTGNAILHRQSPEKLNIVDGSKLYYVLRDYFKNSVLKNDSLVNRLILFFASYFDAPYEGENLNLFFNKIAKSNFSTLRSDLNEFEEKIMDRRSKRMVTIQDEILRSAQEVEIANFLYLNNIEYEYEAIYPYYIDGAGKPYTPDFKIRQGGKEAYVEHFGVTEDGKNNRYSDDQLAAYQRAIENKKRIHRTHNTELIYTFSSYLDGHSLLDHLKEELENHGFKLRPRSSREVMEKLVSSEENRYIRKLILLICRFITNFKTNGYAAEKFRQMRDSSRNVRTQLFLDICYDCYLEYERYLKENHAIDFQDMINESARILREAQEAEQKFDFKYIIVDEYQDISRQRFDLVTALSKVTDAKIIAVGDDWQSIYAFSGSDITLFTKFEEKMGYAKLLKIVKTYRNSQEVIDIAGNFIQKNTAQIKKELKSPKNIEDPVIIYTYDSTSKGPNGDNRSGVNYAIAHAIETALAQIIEFNRREGKKQDSSILLLGRFGFDGDRLERSGLFEFVRRGSKLKSLKYPKLNITFMTAHASKGLGYDNVIVVNGRNETYGFPSKIEDDPVLSLVIRGDRSIDYAEERRLFYVAMTRTKNRVFFVAPEQNPSEFLLEIKHDYKNVVLKGNWNETPPTNMANRKPCPICGYPMQLRYKNAYGLRLWLCTNEPEICDFMTNEYAAGKLSVLKCGSCRDGYLIVKPGRQNQDKSKGYFLGCTNYKSDGTGCRRTVSRAEYYHFMGYSEEEEKEQRGAVPGAEKERKAAVPGAENGMADDPWFFSERPVEKPDIPAVMWGQQNLNEIIYTVLQCLSHISEKRYYGIWVLADVLRGAESDKIKRGHLDEIEEYGMLREVQRETLITIIKWLIAGHYILQTKAQYPVLHPTEEGIHFGSHVTEKEILELKKQITRAEGIQAE